MPTRSPRRILMLTFLQRPEVGDRSRVIALQEQVDDRALQGVRLIMVGNEAQGNIAEVDHGRALWSVVVDAGQV